MFTLSVGSADLLYVYQFGPARSKKQLMCTLQSSHLFNDHRLVSITALITGVANFLVTAPKNQVINLSLFKVTKQLFNIVRDLIPAD